MGQLYTVITNKEAKGKKGAIVAIVGGTKTETAINHLQRISSIERNQVIKITLDITNSMKLIARKDFQKAKQVIDRFHIQKLALEALQEIRIKLRWEVLDRENVATTQAKLHKAKYITEDFSNGDTAKITHKKSFFALHKSIQMERKSKDRDVILFKQYP